MRTAFLARAAMVLAVVVGTVLGTVAAVNGQDVENQPESPVEFRIWTDQLGEHEVQARLVWHDDVSVVLEKQGGDRVHVLVSKLSRADSEYLDSLEKLVGGAEGHAENRSVADRQTQNRQIEVRPVSRANRKAGQSQAFTTAGAFLLPQEEIDLFLKQCRIKKSESLDDLRKSLNASVSRMPPSALLEFRDTVRLLTRDNAVIIPRMRANYHGAGYKSGTGEIFKPCGGSYSPRLPYAEVKTHSIIDDQSAVVEFFGYGPVILEGIDTRHLPRGEWKSYFLLKHVGFREVPAFVGKQKIAVYQTVSIKGFPKDIILW